MSADARGDGSDGMPVAVLTNPSAGGSRYRQLLPEILKRLRGHGAELRELRTSSAAEAEAACRAALAEGAEALVVVGGDGTTHAALQAAAETKVPFAVVPAGTGNDFAAALGLPAEPLTAATEVAAALAAGGTRKLDLAHVTAADGTRRWFGTVLAAGFDAVVNERANRMRWPRGDRRYDLAIVLELLGLRRRRYRLRFDGRPYELDAVLVAVGNTATYGGGMRICPDADPADGQLDIVVGGAFSRYGLARIKPRVYRGTHIEHPLVESFRATTVEIETTGVTTYADGERCLPLPVTVTSVPAALRVISR